MAQWLRKLIVLVEMEVLLLILTTDSLQLPVTPVLGDLLSAALWTLQASA